MVDLVGLHGLLRVQVRHHAATTLRRGIASSVSALSSYVRTVPLAYSILSPPPPLGHKYKHSFTPFAAIKPLFEMLLTAVALAVAAFAGTASAVTATFTNTKRFLFDSDGNQIDAYGANINCESTPLSSKP